MEWEKRVVNDASDKGLIFKIYKQLMHLTVTNNKEPNQKMTRRPKQTFFQRRHTDGQQKKCKDAQYC